ncbi:MAG TPA: DnaB-like helicase C-terminal domain-containing protein [Candidatus Dojkabacteria bacterium]|jgi:replicative DNA helicase|nr:DnaB-like helicase C-terminal domain-containing protein [Candidatus Dojkabacteria bacterium]
MTKPTKWKTQREAFIESLSYLQGRQTGKITSIKTPWQKFNDATTNGIEWHSTTVIGARPATGKTLIKDLIINGAFKLNPLMPFRVLEFQFEMLGKNSAIREYSQNLQVSYKYLCSADGVLSDADFERCKLYAKNKLQFPIDVVEESCNVMEFKETIEDYMKAHAVQVKERNTSTGKDELVLKYKNTIVTLDHSLLLDNSPYGDDMSMLKALGKTVTALKRKYPIAFIILSQLNRNIDAPERNEDGKYGNFILDSDIFGSDALLQHADTLIGLNRPGKQKLTFYGVERYIINQDPTILAMHFLKCRNGETGIGFFRTEFEKMNIVEIPTPARQERRIRT